MEANGIKDQENTTLVIRRHYPVSPEKLWRAWTDPQALSAWFGGGDTAKVLAAEVDLQVGGTFLIRFIAPNGEEAEATGVYQELVPFSRLVMSWAWRGTPERVSRITLEIEAKAEGSELLFVHDRFFDETAATRHQQGWEYMFKHLEACLAVKG